MKKLTILLTFLLLLTATLATAAQQQPATKTAPPAIQRGAALTGAPAVPLAKILASPQRYADKVVTVEGVVRNVCPRKGCWMELAPAQSARGIRVTFKDYGFFVPTDSKGLRVKAEGKIAVKTLSKEETEHLIGEGAQLQRNADGTSNEVSFIANGVELHH